MAWHFGTNPASSTPANNSTCMELFLGAAQAAGWTVPFWSDGTTYHSSGSPTAHFLENDLAFFGITSPDGKNHFCFQSQTIASDTNWYLKWSQLGFIGGSPSATRTPTGSDQVLLAQCSGTDASPGFTSWMGTPSVMVFACACSDVAPYPFYIAQWYVGSGPQACGFFDGMYPGTEIVGDTNPVAMYFCPTVDAWNAQEMTDTNMAGSFGGVIEGTSSPNATALYSLCAPNGQGFPQNPENSKDELLPIWIASDSGGAYLGWEGQLASFYLESTSYSGSGVTERQVPTTLSLKSALDTLVIGSFAIPWDGSSPASDNGPFDAEVKFFIFPSPPSPPPPPIIIAYTPPQVINYIPQTQGLNNGINYGSDILCLNDLDPNFSSISNKLLLVQMAVHRLSTPRGTFTRHPNDGYDLRQWLNEAIDLTSTAETSAIAQDVQQELLKDERIQAVTASASFSVQDDTLSVEIDMTPSQGPSFTFVLSVTALSVSVLSVGNQQ